MSGINASVKCRKCGTIGLFKCACFEQCSCGWIAEAGQPCGNPNTWGCSSKLQNGLASKQHDSAQVIYKTGRERECPNTYGYIALRHRLVTRVTVTPSSDTHPYSDDGPCEMVCEMSNGARFVMHWASAHRCANFVHHEGFRGKPLLLLGVECTC